MKNTYTLEYIIETAMGNKVVKHYTCKDEADLERCKRLHKDGAVEILTINDVLYSDR